MVGRGGRSKACLPCRQQRVKCGKRPFLSGLMEAEDSWPFDPDESKPECLRCRSRGLACTGYPEGLVFINEATTNRRLAPESLPARRSWPGGAEAISNSLIVTGPDVYFSFLLKEMRDDPGTSLFDSRWPGFAAATMSDCLPRDCLECFATSYYGRRQGLDHIQSSGRKLYSRCLRELNSCLRAPGSSTASETIMSIIILTICEVGYTAPPLAT